MNIIIVLKLLAMILSTSSHMRILRRIIRNRVYTNGFPVHFDIMMPKASERDKFRKWLNKHSCFILNVPLIQTEKEELCEYLTDCCQIKYNGVSYFGGWFDLSNTDLN